MLAEVAARDEAEQGHTEDHRANEQPQLPGGQPEEHSAADQPELDDREDTERRRIHRCQLAAANTVAQSFWMLTTVQPWSAAVSSDASAPAV